MPSKETLLACFKAWSPLILGIIGVAILVEFENLLVYVIGAVLAISQLAVVVWFIWPWFRKAGHGR